MGAADEGPELFSDNDQNARITTRTRIGGWDTLMAMTWEEAFTKCPGIAWNEGGKAIEGILHISTLEGLKRFLDVVHIKFCLLKPYSGHQKYPLVESRELLPSFEVDLFEFKELPGFSMVAFERSMDSLHEVFQYDRIHNIMDLPETSEGVACPLLNTVAAQNVQTFRSRLPRKSHEAFLQQFSGRDISYLEHYPTLLEFLLQLERGHVMSTDHNGEFYLSGIYGSFPSDLDSEIKRFGFKIKKFRPGDTCLYERNRLFVYQYLMELYGFPIVSERRTSSALFARRLFRMGERFLIRVLGQSDRTITTLYSHPRAKHYPRAEKIALVAVDKDQKDALAVLKRDGFFVDDGERAIILRIIYKQHRFNPFNVREDRALSVLRQEVIHPLTGEVRSDLNIIKDTYNMILRLTDIVRGEYMGIVTFKRQEIVKDTETHDKRLKFLYSWLSKHQRRIIGYSDEFYAGVVKVLDSYLLNPDNYDVFNDLHEIYQEVWAKYSYIQQARKVKLLEDLLDREYKGNKVSYLEMLQIMTDVLNDLKFEIVNYFDELVENVLVIGDHILNDRYILRNYLDKSDDDLTEYGKKTKKLYSRLVLLLDEFRSIRKSRRERSSAPALNTAI